VVADHRAGSNLYLLDGIHYEQTQPSIKAVKVAQVTKTSAFNESMVVTGDLKWSHVGSEPEKADDLKEADCALLIVDLQPSVLQQLNLLRDIYGGLRELHHACFPQA
jgi:hypothetical protein